MLEGKFGTENYRDVNMAWFWARIHARTPRLGTFEGGFQAFLEEVAGAFRTKGGKLRLNSPIQRIERKEEGLSVTVGDEGEELFDRVLVTLSPSLLMKLVPSLPESYLKSVRQLRSLGAIVLILALDRPLGEEVYWYNLPKKQGFPFLCLVEHTKFLSPEHFGGDHIVYCGDYLPADHPYFSLSTEELLEEYLPGLKKINPDFSKDWIRETWSFREPYAQPIPEVDHSQKIPSIETPIEGLYWASMSHVYPWDRGTNFAIEIGRRAARMMVE
jgi:protoporphyrinogen oxidase